LAYDVDSADVLIMVALQGDTISLLEQAVLEEVRQDTDTFFRAPEADGDVRIADDVTSDKT